MSGVVYFVKRWGRVGAWVGSSWAALMLLVCPVQGAEERPLMRFPDVSGSSIVFAYGGDIWKVPAEGGVAVHLTINDGDEAFPKFSPDGSMIAFTGEYDGNNDVYVMNADGGNITRVTYHPYSDVVQGWHPTKNKILFSSIRNSANYYDHLFLIAPDGTGLEELPLHEAARGSYSPDEAMIAYNRVAREHRTWKRYHGGLAQDVYLYEFATHKDRKLTDFEGTDRIPMWIGDKIYFSSDRDGTLNIYAFDTKTSATTQITKHTNYDVRRPSADGTHIVYELGGELWLLDVQTGKTARVPVEIRADAAEARPYLKEVDGDITDFDCSPSGKRALVVARGEVFTVPKEDGPTRNLTRSSGARDKDAAWSPDGKSVAYISDQSGEYEIYLVNPNGEEKAVRLTHHKDGYRHTLRWSPDSKKIAFADQTLRCYILDVASKKITEVDRAQYENVDVSLDLKPISDVAWSPDSRFIAYSKMDENLVVGVYVYSLDDGAVHRVSDGLFNDFGPVFSRDGKHLFFVSNRRFDPTFDDFDWEMVYKKVAGVYAVTLASDGESVLPFKSDEETTDDEKGNDEKKDGEATEDVRIDFDGIAGRVEALPIPRGNYRSLAAGDGALFYLDKDEGDFNRFEFRNIGAMDLHRFSFDDAEAKTVIEGVDGFRLSADGKTLTYRKGNSIGMIDATATDSKGDALDLGDLKMWFEPLAEWNQIFNEAWRMERDFYYEPGMNGLDWNKMREKYGALMPYVSCRQDVQYVVGELIGELSTSHTYVFGGDHERRAESVNVGMLGVDWTMDAQANRYRFGKIYRVADWTRGTHPPLARPGVRVAEGDYLLQVNGVDVTADRNIYSYFQDLAREQVTIVVNSKPSMAGSSEYTVEPLGGEMILRHLDWVEHNRMVADRESGGDIGYIHLPDTYTGSAREFPKYFLAQTRKKGLIIDGRFNAGGLDPDIFLNRLDKAVAAYWTRRYSNDQTIPLRATRAHMVCLTNRQAGSGGDMLPMEFQMRRMGPVIGTRTWGGLVGVSMWLPLIDGGGLSAPDYRIYGPDGKWLVENNGIQPDIEVDLDPAEMSRGYDAQLMKAIEVLKQEIKDDPRPWPTHEPVTRQKTHR